MSSFNSQAAVYIHVLYATGRVYMVRQPLAAVQHKQKQRAAAGLRSFGYKSLC